MTRRFVLGRAGRVTVGLLLMSPGLALLYFTLPWVAMLILGGVAVAVVVSIVAFFAGASMFLGAIGG